ncbi:hypothetical protein C8J57DRAFT_1226036 [Mycena rebaudengoi]|nr:hypothetical protein C8J57DRAFT_1226036 [Mycena rebaudengoi]
MEGKVPNEELRKVTRGRIEDNEHIPNHVADLAPSTSRISRHRTSSGEHGSGRAPGLRFWRFVIFFVIFLGGAGVGTETGVATETGASRRAFFAAGCCSADGGAPLVSPIATGGSSIIFRVYFSPRKGAGAILGETKRGYRG